MVSTASPYRSTSLRCPRCKTAGLGTEVIGRCLQCLGAWVPEDAVHERVGKMQDRVPPELRWSVAVRDPLPCVACATPMQTLALFEVPVDRCPGHGIWFDVDEMAIVLLRSQEAVRPPLAGFTVADKAEMAVDGTYLAAHVGIEAASSGLGAGLEVADVVAGGAEVAGSVAGGVVEAVLELIGGLLP